ncbi:unnamed protein product [Meganyctiphanes norvegica]|uniref:Calcium-activated chloride channel N-terminal domain-containing protein n=1 Tax=Meganyctiphanes norvegica TaxID=48144 RepID=A0AAV2RJ06_MEGNR
MALSIGKYCLFAAMLTVCPWISTASKATMVVLRDNGYDGVVVAIEDDTPVAHCNEIIMGLEATIRSASSSLFLATRGRANFRSIRVLVPSAWTSSSCPALTEVRLATVEDWATADLRVTHGRHPVHGMRPWTLQTQGCAKPGDYISMGHELLLQNTTEAVGRLVGVEWIKYRYGVFSEVGSPGSPVHPPHYRAPDASWTPNTCANTLLNTHTDCDPSSVTCTPTIRQEDNLGLKSSVMAFPQMPSAVELCDEGSHNHDAPTRQNLICSCKSIWEVLRASTDFQNNRNVEGGLLESEVVFNYVRPQAPRIVLLIEDTNGMNVQKRWEFMRKAIHKTVAYDIPDGYNVGLVVFNSMATIKYHLTTLTDGSSGTREKVGFSLPRNPSREVQQKRCIICGLKEALQVLHQGGPPAGGHIIIITGDSGTIDEAESIEAQKLIDDSQITLHSIVYPLTDKFPRPGGGLEFLAEHSGGHSFIVPDEGYGSASRLGMYYNLLDGLYHTLTTIAPRAALPVKVHSKEHPGGLKQMSQGSFLVDPALGVDTVFAIFYYDVNHVGNQVHLVSPNGQVIDTVNMQKEYHNINMITVRLAEAQVIPGLWKYKVENLADSHQALYVQVTSRPLSNPDSPQVSVRGWINDPYAQVNNSDISLLLALYAEVTADNGAVEGATITATITRLGQMENGTDHERMSVQLLDNGLMGPDMLKADGVYSRYVIGLDAAKYSIALFVEGDIKGYKFARHVRLGVVNVFSFPTSHDVLPPSRIVDLRSSLLPDTVNQVAFSWTAPGGDLDFGQADHYVVMASKNKRELQEGEGTLMEGWPAPLEAQAMQQHTITWLQYDQVHYLVIYAVDEEGNTGIFSNIISVHVPSPPPSTTAAPSLSASPFAHVNMSASKEANGTPSLATLDSRQLSVIFGCIGGFIFVIIIIFCYCILAHRRNHKKVAVKKAQEAQEAYSATVIDNIKGSDFLASNDGMKDILKNECIRPVESWSASQLLSNHNDSKRGSMSARSDNTSNHSDSTKKSYGGSSGHNKFYVENNQFHVPGYPDHYPPPSEDYPTPTESYTVTPTEGYPYLSEARSYISSQPSDSFLSVSCDLPPAYAAYPSYDSSLRSGKVPPPIPPKPRVQYIPEPYLCDSESLDQQSSTLSIISEKRVRNVTMV